MTTPSTSAQGPAAGWRYSINYGPDGEENYANVYAADGQIVGNLRTHHAIAICNAFAVCDSLTASPPPAASPASPSGVRVKVEIKEYTPAGGDHVMIWVNDRITANCGYSLECVPRHVASTIAAALASDATPAATSGSGDGGGPTYVANCCNCGRIIDTREEDAGGDGWGHELSDERWVCSPECLDAVTDPAATPVSESEPVREAAQALIAARSSTYKARNGRVMGIEDDSGEMMWIVPFDEMLALEDALAKPPSSPAGGDVREAAFELLSHLELYEFNERDPSGELYEFTAALKSALSQPTSAGRVGE